MDRPLRSEAGSSAEGRRSLVVIGSGWAGLYIAQHIDTRLYNLTVISPRPTCALTPLLASAACGILPFSCAEEPIRAKNRKCNYIRAEVFSIDLENSKVKCRAISTQTGVSHPEFVVSYEHLVICPGCKLVPSERGSVRVANLRRSHEYVRCSWRGETCNVCQAC